MGEIKGSGTEVGTSGIYRGIIDFIRRSILYYYDMTVGLALKARVGRP